MQANENGRSASGNFTLHLLESTVISLALASSTEIHLRLLKKGLFSAVL